MQSLGGGGAEKVLINLLRNIDYTRNAVTLLLLSGTGVHMNEVPEQVELITLDDKAHPLRDRLFFHLGGLKKLYFKRRLRKLMQGRRFDATVSYLEGQAMFAHSLLMDLSERNVTFVHSDRSRVRYSYKYFASAADEDKAYHRMDAVCFVSEDGRDGFERTLGIHDNLFVINNTVDPAEINTRAAERHIDRHSRFTMVSAGRLSRVKNQALMLDTVAELVHRGRDVELWLLGCGELEQDLKRQAARLDILDRVRFMGFQNNPYCYIAAADMFILTSETESFPTVVSEALCLGKPVVSTRVAGIDEQLGHVAGYVAERTPQALADAVEAVMADLAGPQRLKVGVQSRQCLFNPVSAAERFVNIVSNRNI